MTKPAMSLDAIRKLYISTKSAIYWRAVLLSLEGTPRAYSQFTGADLWQMLE